jgi:hypothetical protein
MSVKNTVRDLYRGLEQGRDVVVPGMANKFYTYVLAKVLPRAATGALTKVTIVYRRNERGTDTKQHELCSFVYYSFIHHY